MDVKISPVVMAIPERARWADALGKELNCEVVYDAERAGPWANARRCWLAAPDDCTHRLVLQDDAILCDGFMDVLHAAVEQRPHHVVNLWSCWPFLLDASMQGISWVRSKARCSGLGLLMPRTWIDPFVAWREMYFDPAWTCCDGPLLLWRLTENDGMHYTVPSLVQHRPEIVSVVNGRPNSEKERQSPYFADAGARSINWDTPSLDMPGRWKRYIAQCVPYLREGVTWPPGEEEDPTFREARHGPRLFGAHL